jgi:rare lipoprotein A
MISCRGSYDFRSVSSRFCTLVTACGALLLTACASSPSSPVPDQEPVAVAVAPPISQFELLAPAALAEGLLTPLVTDFPASLLAPDILPAPATEEMLVELERGGASWYGPGFHGRRTASGERYDMNAMTAAHRTLPFGSLVRVRSLLNGREVQVRITDRGPFVKSRVIDLSRAAALQLGMLELGFKQVVLALVPSPTAALPPFKNEPQKPGFKAKAKSLSSPSGVN